MLGTRVLMYVHMPIHFTYSHKHIQHLTASGHPAVCSENGSERCPVSCHGNCGCLFNVRIIYLVQHLADAANSLQDRTGEEIQNSDSKKEVQ